MGLWVGDEEGEMGSGDVVGSDPLVKHSTLSVHRDIGALRDGKDVGSLSVLLPQFAFHRIIWEVFCRGKFLIERAWLVHKRTARRRLCCAARAGAESDSASSGPWRCDPTDRHPFCRHDGDGCLGSRAGQFVRNSGRTRSVKHTNDAGAGATPLPVRSVPETLLRTGVLIYASPHGPDKRCCWDVGYESKDRRSEGVKE
jgi:hypothetical protein